MTRIETGSCFCGSVTAEMHGDPFWICSDLDDDCRKAIGSPLTVWVGCRPAQFRLLTGTPKPSQGPEACSAPSVAIAGHP
jgi:hypothetical protein